MSNSPIKPTLLPAIQNTAAADVPGRMHSIYTGTLLSDDPVFRDITRLVSRQAMQNPAVQSAIHILLCSQNNSIHRAFQGLCKQDKQTVQESTTISCHGKSKKQEQ